MLESDPNIERLVGDLTVRVTRSGPMAAMLLLTSLAAAPASAQEYCVSCTGPDALYRCVIEGARPGGAASLSLLCVSSLAKSGPHATCAIRRDLGVIDCNGVIKRVSIPTADAPLLTEEAPPPPRAGQPAGQPAQGDPSTVAEMLQRAKKQNERAWEKTNEQIKSNNDKIGGFFKQSWDCVSSLFLRCSEKQP